MHYLPAKSQKTRKRVQSIAQFLGNQQNWFAKYINKKAYSTFSPPIGKLFDVVFSRTTIHDKLQNLMSSTFKYSFTNAQDFCARKGNKISLSYYWKISIYAWLEVLIHMRLKCFCNLYQGSSLPISTYTYDILSFASVFPLTISYNFLVSALSLGVS